MGSEHWQREDPQSYHFMALHRGRLVGPACGADLQGALFGRGVASAFRASGIRKVEAPGVAP